MASQSNPEERGPSLRVEIDAVALWEPLGKAKQDASSERALGISVQSWGFRPPADAARACRLVIVESAQDYRLEDGTTIVVGKAREWSVDGRYVETREYAAADGTPRPKHFFEL